MMIQNNCGEIPVVDGGHQPVGVITDRDIVCRVVAEGKNPPGHPVESFMTRSVISVSADATLDDVIATMAGNQIRRVLVVDNSGCCTGIIAQADLASVAPPGQAAEFVRDVSRDSGHRPAGN
jgi:CBS domain-containing protein